MEEADPSPARSRARPTVITTAIPIHRPDLTELEGRRVDRTLQSSGLGATCFVAPEGLDVGGYERRWPEIRVERFPDEHFRSVATYSQWLLGTSLYRRFEASDFLLVCQTDAVLLRPLPTDEEWAFDYLGAVWARPWTVGWDPVHRGLTEHRLALRRRTVRVGNGGLSLRRIAAFARMPSLAWVRRPLNEDVTISYLHDRLGIRVASPEVARCLFIETEAKAWRPGDPVPDVYGYHGLDRHNPALEAVLLGPDGGGPTR